MLEVVQSDQHVAIGEPPVQWRARVVWNAELARKQRRKLLVRQHAGEVQVDYSVTERGCELLGDRRREASFADARRAGDCHQTHAVSRQQACGELQLGSASDELCGL